MTKNLSLRDIGLLTIIRDMDAQNVNIPSVDFLPNIQRMGYQALEHGLTC